jgi:hypothetical protein
MPLLVKNSVYWIGFEYSNLLQICTQNHGYTEMKGCFWDQFWEQKKKPLTEVKGFDCLLSLV